MSEQKDYLEIPEEIKLDKDGEIIFNDGKQLLFEENGEFTVYTIWSVWISKSNSFCLLPCEFEDLAVGDTAFREIKFSTEEDFKSIYFYCKILSGKRFVFINDGVHDDGEIMRTTYINDTPYKQWYKVVKRGEVEE